MIVKMHPALKVLISFLTIGIYEFYWSVNADRELRTKEDLQWSFGFTVFFVMTSILTFGIYAILYMIYRTVRTQLVIFYERDQKNMWLILSITSIVIIIIRPIMTWITQVYANERE